MERRQRLLAIITTVIIAALLVWGIATAISRRGKVHLEIIVAPSDSSLTIDGQSAKPGWRWIKKGGHTLKATRQFFADANKMINTGVLDLTQPVYLSLMPNSPEGQQYLIDHPEEQQIREAAGAAQDQSTQQDLTKTPLLSQLPFIAPGFEFQIDYDAKTDDNGATQVTIYILADTEEAKQHARDWISSQGTDPSTLHIVYQANDVAPDNPNVGHQ